MNDKALTPEEALAKRIAVFPSEEEMTDEAIKRNVIAAMNNYAEQFQSRIAELERELLDARDAGHAWYAEVDKLRSRIAELEHQVEARNDLHKQHKERIAELERENKSYQHQLIQSQAKEYHGKQLNETLMGLLEEQFRNYHIQYIYEDYPIEEARTRTATDWQSYCKEHNLKIDTDGK